MGGSNVRSQEILHLYQGNIEQAISLSDVEMGPLDRIIRQPAVYLALVDRRRRVNPGRRSPSVAGTLTRGCVLKRGCHGEIEGCQHKEGQRRGSTPAQPAPLLPWHCGRVEKRCFFSTRRLVEVNLTIHFCCFFFKTIEILTRSVWVAMPIWCPPLPPSAQLHRCAFPCSHIQIHSILRVGDGAPDGISGAKISFCGSWLGVQVQHLGSIVLCIAKGGTGSSKFAQECGNLVMIIVELCTIQVAIGLQLG